MSFSASLANLTFDCTQNGWVDSDLVSVYTRQYPSVPFPRAVNYLPPVTVNPGTTANLILTIFNPRFVFVDGRSVTISARTYAINSLGVRGAQIGECLGVVAQSSQVMGSGIPGYKYSGVDLTPAFWADPAKMADTDPAINMGPGVYRDVALYITMTENDVARSRFVLPPITCRVFQFQPYK